jgi:hypothetical protein
MIKLKLLTLAAMLVTAAPVMAQGRGRNTNGVPPGQRPPAGMCRIWIDGVPPGQQPAPTDCATAAARRPANSRIIYGDQANTQGGILGGVLGRRSGTNDGQMNGQQCVQGTDRNGQLRTYCDNDRERDDDRDGGYRRGTNADGSRADVQRDARGDEGKAKKHKGKGRGGDDRDR